jgi:hypothetical protein
MQAGTLDARLQEDGPAPVAGAANRRSMVIVTCLLTTAGLSSVVLEISIRGGVPVKHAQGM